MLTTQQRMAIEAATKALLETLPPIPAGHYISNCADPECGCFGWHIYKHGAWSPDLEGHLPTGEFYCNGGDGPMYQHWVDLTLQAFDASLYADDLFAYNTKQTTEAPDWIDSKYVCK